MNHIFKVIWCASTQKWIAVSELSKSNHRQRSYSVNKRLSSIFLVGCSLTFGGAATIDDGTLPLTDSSTVPGNLDYIVGNSSGIFYTDNGTNLTISNATNNTPAFVVAGYSSLAETQNASASSEGNTIILEKGEIQGDIYSGLGSMIVVDPIVCNDSNPCQKVDKQSISNDNT